MTKVLQPFFRQFGSKWRLSKRLEAPAHDTIVEPFAGAAGYSHRYGAGKRVELYDINDNIAAIWDYLLGADERTILNLPVDFGLTDIRTLGLGRAPMLLIQRWLRPNGSGTAWSLPPLASAHVRGGTYWDSSARARIASQLQYIKFWTFEQKSYELVDVHREVTWSVDPVYKNNAHSKIYRTPPLDYQMLGEWCMGLRGQVFVHEQFGADWLPFETLNASATAGHFRDGYHKRQHEVCWKGSNA